MTDRPPPDSGPPGPEPARTSGVELPPKPAEPLPGDCCGGGCALCVFDLYQRDLEAWQQRVDELLKRHPPESPTG